MTRREKLWLAVLLAAVVVRLLTLAAYPLHDTTEARYAEIARLMVTTGDWVVPQVEPGVPFWGKPPLSMWLTSASFSLLGFTEFAARLPELLLALGIAAVIYAFGRETGRRESGIAAAAVFMTTALGFVLAGAVMTDATLVAATTVAMAAYWCCVDGGGRRWGYLYFAALAAGLLAKGPVALVMGGVPAVVWRVLRGGAGPLAGVPLFGGTLLMVAVAVPWYLLVESRSPGFLEYFLVGEHWHRFIDSGWQGDLYGAAHAYPRGSIWAFGFLAALPWSVPAIAAGIAWWRRRPRATLTPLKSYLLLWLLMPLAFFTFAGNILPTYVATGLPAFAILVGARMTTVPSGAIHAGWVLPALVAAAAVVLPALSLPQKTQHDIVAWQQVHGPALPLYYYPRKPYSADFYSRGAALRLGSPKEFAATLAAGEAAFVAVRKSSLETLPAAARGCLLERTESLRYVLFEKAASCTAAVSPRRAAPPRRRNTRTSGN